jgi:lipid A disaccharide synthetase
MRVFVSAGEPSGDHHAALLVREIRASAGPRWRRPAANWWPT